MAGDVLGGGGFSPSALNSRKFKEPVRAVATTSITLSGAQTVDDVDLVAGDRVLVTAQAAASNNRIWVVASGAWTAAADSDSNAEIVDAAVQVLHGTANAGAIYVQATALADISGDGPLWVAVNPGVATAVRNAANTWTVGGQVFARDTASVRGLVVGGTLIDPVDGAAGVTLAGAAGATAYLLQGVSDTRWVLLFWDDGDSTARLTTATASLRMIVQGNGGPLVLGTGTSAIGFYGSAGGAKPTVTGSRATGAALTSLLTALATLGLITDSSTA